MTPLQVAEAVALYCAWSRGSVTSWIRSPERNAEVGGVPTSKHLVGLAMDVGYAPNPKPPLTQAKARAKHLGLKLLREADHDHLQTL